MATREASCGKAKRWLATLIGALCASAALRAAEPGHIGLGSVLARAGAPVPVRWSARNVAATIAEGALRLEPAAGQEGSIETEPLPLVPLRLYTLAVTTQRGPGTEVRFQFQYQDAAGRVVRPVDFQLADRSRPNWIPLAPFRQEYRQQLSLGPGASDIRLRVQVKGHPDAGFNRFELFDLRLTEGQPVRFGAGAGPNLLGLGGMEQTGPDGMPCGWGTWMGPPTRIATAVSDASGRGPHGGSRFLRVEPPKGFLLVAPGVPVAQGRAYRISFWARGKAQLSLMAHPLDSSWPELRVGDPQARQYSVDSPEWQRFEQVWFADSPRVVTAQVLFGVTPTDELHLDDVEFGEIE